MSSNNNNNNQQQIGGKLMPNLDQNSTKMLNLTVLQRMDPHIEDILITSAHVTFYSFDVVLNQWSRKDVEGSLFVVKRNTQPRFQFIVMNRRNTDNLVEDLLGDFEYEIQEPYLLYRNAAQEVNGIWFYNSRECEEVANLFTRILSAYSKVHPKPKSLSKSDFEEIEAVPITSIIEGPVEPSFVSPGSVGGQEDSSFMNFFNTAMNIGHNANVTPSPSPVPQLPVLPLPVPSNLPIQLQDTPEQISSGNWITNLIKPSTFISPPISSSVPISSSLPTSFQPHLNLQGPHGTPLLQPFPPPTPPPSLAPVPNQALNYGYIDRDKVRDAFSMLVQDNHFIDMVYQALQKVHHQS